MNARASWIRTIGVVALARFCFVAVRATGDDPPGMADPVALVCFSLTICSTIAGAQQMPRVPRVRSENPLLSSTITRGAEQSPTFRRLIMLPESMTSLPTTDSRRAYFLLAHETFHILSRTDSQLRDDLYALLGFTAVEGFEYLAELEERRISNPDAFEYLHTLTVQSGSESVDVMPVIQSLLPLNEVIQLPNFFDALDIVLLSVDASTGEVFRDGNGDLEEILADNFATLMEWISDGVLPPANPDGFPVNDVDLLTAIEHVLTSGC